MRYITVKPELLKNWNFKIEVEPATRECSICKEEEIKLIKEYLKKNGRAC